MSLARKWYILLCTIPLHGTPRCTDGTTPSPFTTRKLNDLPSVLLHLSSHVGSGENWEQAYVRARPPSLVNLRSPEGRSPYCYPDNVGLVKPTVFNFNFVMPALC